MARERLTAKQETFANLVFQGYPLCDAWVEAGYSNKYPMTTLYPHASRLASLNKVKARIAQLRKRTENESVATVLERKQRLTEYIRTNLVDFIDENGSPALTKDKPGARAISEYTVHQTKYGERRHIKLGDPISAITELNKMERLYSVDANISNDNRTINIIVKSDDGKQVLENLRTGKLPEPQSFLEGENHSDEAQTET